MTVRRLYQWMMLNVVGRSAALPAAWRAAAYKRGGIAVGRFVTIQPGSFVRPGRIDIQDGAFVNFGCYVDAGTGRIEIQERAAIGPYSILAANSHHIGGPTCRAGQEVSGDIVIGYGAWVGARSVVLPGVTVGSGCIIGAGSVVTRDTEPNCLYTGSPARLRRRLD